MLNFISFGSGSSGNCYLIYTETFGLIIDMGIGPRILKKHFVNYGLSMNIIKAVLLTHDHADHVKAVGAISSSLHLPVYATKETFHGVRRNYSVHKKIESINEHVIEKSKTFYMDDFIITPFAVPHDSSDCVGYEIVYKDKTFCLMTDVGHITDEMKRYIAKCNYLVIEANYDGEMLQHGRYPQFLKDRITSGNGHSSNVECANAIINNASENLEHIWLCHLSEENNNPDVARNTIEQMLNGADKVIGRDFNLTVLNRKTPTGVFLL